MKRLNYYLLHMERNTTTYREMYEGEVTVIPAESGMDPWTEYDQSYYFGEEEIMVTVSHSNRLAGDKPTLIFHVPAEALGITSYTAGAADFCLRQFAPYVDALNEELANRRRTKKETGYYELFRPSGKVVVRNSAYFALCPRKDYENGGGNRVYLHERENRQMRWCLCILMQVQLPVRNVKKARIMLCRDLPRAVNTFVRQFDRKGLEEACALENTQRQIREWLKDSPYCAFIANGSIIPRKENSELPLPNGTPFLSPPEDEIEICGVKGMGICRGVTVITGGGYSGKSTLLEGIAAGIYNHVPGDGREFCITDDSGMKISTEEGRSVKNINISPFIQWLKNGEAADFSTDHASGSTSQAANIMEAISYGAKVLFIDEDSSAANFMIRDERMKKLIRKEPVTPFTDRVKELYSSQGVSTILVIGGSGEYLSVADRVYLMEDFCIRNVTGRAKELCGEKNGEEIKPACWEQIRKLRMEGFTTYPEGSGSERLEVTDTGFLMIGDEAVDLRGLHSLISQQQAAALGFMLRSLENGNKEPLIDLEKAVSRLYGKIEKEGLDVVFSGYFTGCGRFLELPGKQALFAVIDRMRLLRWDR